MAAAAGDSDGEAREVSAVYPLKQLFFKLFGGKSGFQALSYAAAESKGVGKCLWAGKSGDIGCMNGKEEYSQGG